MASLIRWTGEFEQAPGDGEEQGTLACCSPWDRKELDTTERLNNKLLGNSRCVSLLQVMLGDLSPNPTHPRYPASFRKLRHLHANGNSCPQALLGKTDILGEDRHPAPTLSRGLSVCQTTLRYNLQAELGLWPALQAAQGRELASDPLNLPEASGKTWSCACSRSPLSQEGLQQPRLWTTPREMPQGQGPNKPTD